jgi:hypothetical protein
MPSISSWIPTRWSPHRSTRGGHLGIALRRGDERPGQAPGTGPSAFDLVTPIFSFTDVFITFISPVAGTQMSA